MSGYLLRLGILIGSSRVECLLSLHLGLSSTLSSRAISCVGSSRSRLLWHKESRLIRIIRHGWLGTVSCLCLRVICLLLDGSLRISLLLLIILLICVIDIYWNILLLLPLSIVIVVIISVILSIWIIIISILSIIVSIVTSILVCKMTRLSSASATFSAAALVRVRGGRIA